MVKIRHIALFVPDLQEAERFYEQVLGMVVMMREALLEDGQWYTLRPEKGWDDALAANVEIGMLALERGDFILALFPGRPAAGKTVMEIGISVPAGEIAGVRERLPDTVAIVRAQEKDLLFVDPFGYRWHIHAAGVAFKSNGEAAGRWLEV